MKKIEPEMLTFKSYPTPERKQLRGLYSVLQPFDRNLHTLALYNAFSHDKEGIDWTYLPYGPFYSESSFFNWVDMNCLTSDPLFYTVCIDEILNPVGMLSLLKIEPNHGKIELGHVHFSLALQQTAASTEALYLIMKFIFEEMGYRRLEWKCDNANERSKRSAIRLGFTFEGLFRQHWIIKSRNRDTAWYSIIDKEWLDIKVKLENWLDPNNFSKDKRQIKKLSEF